MLPLSAWSRLLRQHVEVQVERCNLIDRLLSPTKHLPSGDHQMVVSVGSVVAVMDTFLQVKYTVPIHLLLGCALFS